MGATFAFLLSAIICPSRKAMLMLLIVQVPRNVTHQGLSHIVVSLTYATDSWEPVLFKVYV